MKTKDEMIERYNLLYEKMSDSKNPKNMKIFGEAEKYMFREIAVAHPDMAETWLSHLEAVCWDNYLSERGREYQQEDCQSRWHERFSLGI